MKMNFGEEGKKQRLAQTMVTRGNFWLQRANKVLLLYEEYQDQHF